jgi:putative ABC transport system ATP-binding protein
MTSALELRQVSKVYGSGPSKVHALSRVDLAVERGELVAVMGPSGSGKSTLLTIAGSLEEPTSGEVLVDGVDLATVSRSDQAKMRRTSIGYVFQDFNLLPGLNAIENVTLPLELDGVPARAARTAALEAMEELDVADRVDRYPLALLGALLGIAGAYIALAATYRDDLDYLSDVPVVYLVLAVVGVPLVASAAGWLLAGREPPAIARTAIE